ncbi:SMI1/KNR4 family protein [Streptomyces sp. PSKA30]|uniref:SMI1/KNR4 family protein n=1 Tax=Streptomyces sp. PSKA30 TaxID=2874597 RepID=UPI001CD135C6|nr:SMI1/KNR4 family protein [Streptomyces sp. PSKA30]MBZ9640918.1 SMI1/KNR4 family protein [Streptomyces sp. PSKA30]
MTHAHTSVRTSWARIDAWLQHHAPATFAQLAPPADPHEYDSAQKEMGLRFPAGLLESLDCHNGAEPYTTALPQETPLSLAEIVEFWRTRMTILEREEEPTESLNEDEEHWWHRLWIPWAAIDGDAQVIDMRPGPGQGRIGSALRDDNGNFDGDWGWPSLEAYLFQVAEALEFGDPVGDLVPYLKPNGELCWAYSTDIELDGYEITPAPTTRSRW